MAMLLLVAPATALAVVATVLQVAMPEATIDTAGRATLGTTTKPDPGRCSAGTEKLAQAAALASSDMQTPAAATPGLPS